MKKVILPLLIFLISRLATAEAVSFEDHSLEERYKSAAPFLGIQLSTALGNIEGSGHKFKSYQFTTALEWSRPFGLPIGTFGIEPYLHYSSPSEDNNHGQNPYRTVWGYGARALYQARIFETQALLPVAGYSLARLNYQLVSGLKSTEIVQGPVFGLWLDLGHLDRSRGMDVFSNSGIARFYLTNEVHSASEALGGKWTYYLGIRAELE